jgi:hypothetical protein
MGDDIKLPRKETWPGWVVAWPDGGKVLKGEEGDQTRASDACLVETCYVDREPFGEYIYFAASDASAVRDGKILINEYRYLAEVRVTFEPDLVETGADDIAWCRADAAEQGDGFARTVWPSWQEATLGDVAYSIFPPGQDFVMAKSVLEVGTRGCAWLDVIREDADSPAEMMLSYARIDEDRLLEIKVILKDNSVPISQMVRLWSDLLSRYRDLAYQPLQGASRVEMARDLCDHDSEGYLN